MLAYLIEGLLLLWLLVMIAWISTKLPRGLRGIGPIAILGVMAIWAASFS